MGNKNKKYKLLLIIACVLVPVLVGVLYLLPDGAKDFGIDTSILPKLNALINSITAVLLLAAVVAIKKGKESLHKKIMLSAMGLGALFLVSYVLYHFTTASVKYGDANHDGVVSQIELNLISSYRWIYYVVLLSHVLLSIIVLPFVLFSAYYALIEERSTHKKIVKFAFPVWLYVSITGVIVYFMISPYYVQ